MLSEKANHKGHVFHHHHTGRRVKKKTRAALELVTLVQQQHLFLKQGTESLKTLGAQSPHANICLPPA